MCAMRSSAQHPILMRFFAPNSKFAQLYSINSEFSYVYLEQRNNRLRNMLMTMLWPEPGMIFLAAFFAWFGLTLVDFIDISYVWMLSSIVLAWEAKIIGWKYVVRSKSEITDKIFHHVPWVHISYTIFRYISRRVIFERRTMRSTEFPPLINE